jgi:perosamine synthetase
VILVSKLALFGGTPVRNKAIPWVNTMGKEEMDAVIGVMESGHLSEFIGRSGEKFLGGSKVRKFEEEFAKKFGSSYAVSFNSATTALHSAIAACEIGPGDEVLVTPFSMVATASAILMNNAIPVFVDIETDTYNMDPSLIEEWITPRTKAIMVANIFGLPANLNEIKRIAKKHHLYIIEDNAQSPGATCHGMMAGAIGDIGVFSLNYHKVIHSGEGGMILTNNPHLAYRCQLVRNHGEIVVDDTQDWDTVVLGSNYRMTELHAAIGIEQLKKLDRFLTKRRILGDYLTRSLYSITGLRGVTIPEAMEHAYYVYPIQFSSEDWGISREVFIDALKAEGFPLGAGYVKPIYLLPIFQHKRVYNKTQFPFSLVPEPTQQYVKGLCPVAESLYEKSLLIADVCREPYCEKDIDMFMEAIVKVWDHRYELR